MKDIENINNLQKPQKKSELSLLDLLFILLLATSFSELFLLPNIVQDLQSGSMKPSWGIFAIIVLLVEPYKDIVYVSTVIVGVILLISAIYQSWSKKKNL